MYLIKGAYHDNFDRSVVLYQILRGMCAESDNFGNRCSLCDETSFNWNESTNGINAATTPEL